MTKVVLYIPPGKDFAQVNDQLHHYCASKNYQIMGIDRDGKPWWDTLTAAHRMGAEVIVAASEQDVPGDRTPRLEIADVSADRPDLPGGGHAKPRNRRPRPV